MDGHIEFRCRLCKRLLTAPAGMTVKCRTCGSACQAPTIFEDAAKVAAAECVSRIRHVLVPGHDRDYYEECREIIQAAVEAAFILWRRGLGEGGRN